MQPGIISWADAEKESPEDKNRQGERGGDNTFHQLHFDPSCVDMIQMVIQPGKELQLTGIYLLPRTNCAVHRDHILPFISPFYFIIHDLDLSTLHTRITVYFFQSAAPRRDRKPPRPWISGPGRSVAEKMYPSDLRAGAQARAAVIRAIL